MPSDLSGWLAGLSPWSVLLALISILAGWILARIARRTVAGLLTRLRGLSPKVSSLTARVVYYAVLLLAIGVALTFLGAPVQPLLAATVIVAVLAALALRGITDNFASGLVLQTRRPIDIGDLICSDDRMGTVVDMNGRSVLLRTADGAHVHVPNSTVLQNTLINYSEGGGNRSEIEVRLRVDDDDRRALRRRLAELVTAVPGVSGERPVQVITILDSPERLIVRVWFWHPPADGALVTSAVVEAVAEFLRATGSEAVVTSALPPAPATPSASL
jgi:small conductance mechanosensitive channel